MNFARRSFLATTLAGQPTAILLQQAMGPSNGRYGVPEAIPEVIFETGWRNLNLGITVHKHTANRARL